MGHAAIAHRRTTRYEHPQHVAPHWHGSLKPEDRYLLPFNSFAEYAREPNPETKKDVVWLRWTTTDHRQPSLVSGPSSKMTAAPVQTGARPAPRIRLLDDPAERGR